MRAVGIALTIIIALALQTSLARFLTPGGGLVDLVFIAVVYIALSSGPTAGMIAGAVAGLSQDALAASGTLNVVIGAGTVSTQSIIGIGSLAKTVVGFFSGVVGSRSSWPGRCRGRSCFHRDGHPCDHICRTLPPVDRGFTQATAARSCARWRQRTYRRLIFQINDYLPISSTAGGRWRRTMRISRRLD